MSSLSGDAMFTVVMMVIAAMALFQALGITNSSVIEEKMLEFRAKEIARNIELISSYDSPGYAKKIYTRNISFYFYRSVDPPTKMKIGYDDRDVTVDVGVELEPQSYDREFATEMLCMRQDAWREPWNPDADGDCSGTLLDLPFGDFTDPVCEIDGRLDAEGGDDDLEFSGSGFGQADEYVQVYEAGRHGGDDTTC